MVYKIKKIFLISIFLSLFAVSVQFCIRNPVRSMIIYYDINYCKNIKLDGMSGKNKEQEILKEKFNQRTKLGCRKSNALYKELSDCIKKAQIITEVDFPNVDLSFLDDNNSTQAKQENTKVPISNVDLNTEYMVLVRRWFKNDEIFYIGDSEYIKFNNVFYFTGNDFNRGIITELSKEFE